MVSRSTLSSERGFTLIELLIVVLTIGVLAAIAVPTFLAQRDKAQDADSKSQARTAVTAVEACGTDAGGEYTNCTDADVQDLPNGVAITGQGPDTYTVTATHAVSGRSFTIGRAAGAVITRSCSDSGVGGCTANSDW